MFKDHNHKIGQRQLKMVNIAYRDRKRVES